MSRKPSPLSIDPDLVLGTNGRMYANAEAIPLAHRTGRRVVRCVELTPGEASELLRRVGELTGELLVGFTANKGRAR